MILPPWLTSCLRRIEHNFPVCPFLPGVGGHPLHRVNPPLPFKGAIGRGHGSLHLFAEIKSKSAVIRALSQVQQALHSLYTNQKFGNKIAAPESQLGPSSERKSNARDF